MTTKESTCTHIHTHIQCRPTRAYIHTHVVLKEVWVVPLDAVIQYGHHHVFTRVAPLPSPHDVHIRLTVMDVVVTVLQWGGQEVKKEKVTNKRSGKTKQKQMQSLKYEKAQIMTFSTLLQKWYVSHTLFYIEARTHINQSKQVKSQSVWKSEISDNSYSAVSVTTLFLAVIVQFNILYFTACATSCHLFTCQIKMYLRYLNV